jgi:hypothetical protein
MRRSAGSPAFQLPRRAEMRESSTPRNSELAVRNQFFTPRYVVEFLPTTHARPHLVRDAKRVTALKEECRSPRGGRLVFLSRERLHKQWSRSNITQEDLLKNPVYVEHRPTKDPRSQMLDPHVGRALCSTPWSSSPSMKKYGSRRHPASKITGNTLHEDFSDIDQLRACWLVLDTICTGSTSTGERSDSSPRSVDAGA